MSVIAPGQWRNAELYRPILASGRSALAWELLRRDADYRKEFTRKPVPQESVVSAGAECASRWGLHFRL